MSKTPWNSEKKYLMEGVKNRIALAAERMKVQNLSPVEFKGLYQDIQDYFRRESNDKIFQAIEHGSMGRYGVHHKITIQVVGYWIHSYLKELKTKDYGRL